MSDFGGGEARYDIIVDASSFADLGEILGDGAEEGVARTKRAVRGLDLAFEQLRRRLRVVGRRTGIEFGEAVAIGMRSSSAAVQRAALNALTAAQKAAASQAASTARVAVAQQATAARAAAQQVRGAQQAAAQQARAAQQASAQAARQRLAQTVAAGKQQAAITQGIEQRSVLAARAAGQQRVAITRFFLDTLSRLERGFGRAVVGIAQTSVGAVRRIFAGTVGSLQRSFAERRSIIQRNTRSEVHIFQNAARQVQAIQQQTRQGVLGGISGGALLGGLGAGLGVGSLLTSGFQRAADIENIQKRLNVLLNNNVFASRALFLQLAAFARTTAFDLTGVSDLASRLLAVGRNVDQILPDIEALSGAITLVGGTTDDLNGIARAIGQIGSLGKLTAEEMNQISERLPGINITELFTKSLGFESSRAFIEAREAGEITADAAIDAFFRAMRFDPRFKAALAEGANSFSNLRANAVESFQDVGAAFVERLEGPIKRGLRGTIDALSGLASFIRGGELTNGLELLRVVLGKVALGLGAVVAAKAAVEVFQLLGKGVGFLLSPLGLLATALAASVAAFSFFFQRSERFRSIVLDIRDAAFRFGEAIFDRVVAGLRAAREALDPLIRPLVAFKDRIIAIATAVQNAFRAGGISAAFEILRRNIGNLARDLFAASLPLRERIGDILGSASDLALSFRDRLVAAFRAIDFGAILSFFRTSLGQTIGAGVTGALAGGVIAGPLGAVLGAGIGVAIARFVVPTIRRAIDGINVGALFGKFLNGVREVGRRLALILTDRRTLLGVAGIAAAAAAIAVQFISGFVSGLLSNLDDIAAAGATILKTLFNQNSVIQSALALALLFGRQLVAAFRQARVGRDAGREVATQIAQGAQEQSFLGRLTGLGRTIGAKLGAGLSIGLGSALAGSAVGSATNDFERNLGLATLGSSIIAGFAAFGPAGAAAAGGLGVVTAGLQSNARVAEEAKGRVEEYLVILQEVGLVGEEAGSAIKQHLTGALKELSTGELEALERTSFSVREFVKALQSGQGEAFVRRISLELVGPDGKISGSGSNAFRFLDEQLNALRDAAGREPILDRLVSGQGQQRLRATGSEITSIIDRLKESGEAARDAARDRAELFRQERSAALETALSAVRDRAREIGEKADEARRKLRELLTPQVPDLEVETAEAATSVPGLAGQVEEAIKQGATSGLGKANLTLALADFGAQVSEATSLAVGDPEALAGIRWDLTQAVNSSGVGEAAKQELLTALNEALLLAESPEAVKLKTEADQVAAAAAGQEARAAALQAATAAGEIPVAAAADIASAIASGRQITASADAIVRNSPAEVKARADLPLASSEGNRIAAAADAAVQAKQITVDNISADTGAAYGVGSDIASGIVRGLRAGLGSVQSEANRLAMAAINSARATLQTGSPSKIFFGIGQDVVDGLIEGIENSSTGAVSAISDVVRSMIEATTGLAGSIRSGLGDLFGGIFDAERIRRGGVVQEAVGGLTLALRGISDQVAQNAEAIWNAAAKPLQERTLSERLLIGESFTSLRLGDELGVANRSAVQAAVDQIREIGAALIEQGASAQQAANAMDDYRSKLIQTAIQAGLSTAEVVRFVDSLGLSPQSLNKFVTEAARLRDIVNEAQRQAKAPTPPPPLTTGPNPVQQHIEIHEHLPTGDPQANALAVVNRLALALR